LGTRNQPEMPMAPARPFWKGYLKLSLVSCPVALYAGTSTTERVSFRHINRQTGNRLRQQLVDKVTCELVEGRGRRYKYAKNAHIPVDDYELDAIALASTHTIDIDSFVPREQIDQRYLDDPYYLTPSERAGQEAYAVIREAMRDKRMVALGRIVLAKRERIIMIEPWRAGLIATTLRYPYEIRDAKDYFDDIADIALKPEMLKLAEQILHSKAADFDPSQYEEAVIELFKKEQAGVPVSRERAPTRPQNTMDLMDALRGSVAQGRSGSIPPRRSERQGETGPSCPGERDQTPGPGPTNRPSVRGRRKRALLDHHKPVLMTEGPIEDRERMHDPDECIDDVDRALNPIGRYFRHTAMHAGTIPMVCDEFGRCLKCLKLGFWRADA
jgi:DNA end-binding protein Ku